MKDRQDLIKRSENSYAFPHDFYIFKTWKHHQHGTHRQIWTIQPIRLDTFQNSFTEVALAPLNLSTQVGFQSHSTYKTKESTFGLVKRFMNGFIHKKVKLHENVQLKLLTVTSAQEKEGYTQTWSDNGF